MSQDDYQPDRTDPLPVNPTLRPHQSPPAVHTPAEQGPAPADAATRPASGIVTQTGEGLSTDEVTALIGGADASATETILSLETAEGLDPQTES
ncbi:hypothetical protein GCM10008955_17060 [Deinococcus malanensis]|uniref:Uncharacterized protein n=1 Tax=Deinococcus malanensis TaxID=1706855 RepID=A0ABQ2EVL9_9DEIO|nr:hypothetical protein [Deinococcus malanensis]GGK24063.1 hypothetical protein GCM10008955_17060 [Deinococcus malanensis]